MPVTEKIEDRIQSECLSIVSMSRIFQERCLKKCSEDDLSLFSLTYSGELNAFSVTVLADPVRSKEKGKEGKTIII